MGKKFGVCAGIGSSWPTDDGWLVSSWFRMNTVLGTMRSIIDEPRMVVAIAGMSASGKTTLARDLAEQLDASLVQMDSYYRDIPAGRLVEDLNWDDPEMFHLDEWRDHLEALGRGESVPVPRYDFRTSLRSGFLQVRSSPVIVAEGQFALHPNAVPGSHCLNVFVDVEVSDAFARRLKRDVIERGRDEDSIRKQWESHVVPAWQNWVEPSRLRADLVLRGDSDRRENLGLAMRALEESRSRLAYLR